MRMTARFIVGDVLEVLPTLDAGSVDLVLTSPPFLALRSYLPADHPDKSREGGSQPTPGGFIDWLVDVVEALDRVLAPHGSMVIELGDTYAGSSAVGGDELRGHANGFRGGKRGESLESLSTVQRSNTGWPADKSLTLIPELFRMTLVYGFNPLTGRQTRRWRLRNVIRWVRPNPPVGALGDKFRPATSELMVFCRTDEAGRKRYFDLDSVREAFSGDGVAHGSPSPELGQTIRKASDELNNRALDAGARRMPVTMNTHAGAPPLDWWSIPPGGYQGAHYAVFPEALCVRPIKAMSPEKVCRTCGEPSRRIVGEAEYVQRRNGMPRPDKGGRSLVDHSHDAYRGLTEVVDGTDQSMLRVAPTLGWSDCSHDNYRPGMVLDPFAGSGTTLAVAVGHGRDAIGIDLDERNADLARERIGMFLEAV